MLSGKRATLSIKQYLGFLILGHLCFNWGLFGQTIAPPTPTASTFTIYGFTTSSIYPPNGYTGMPSFNPNSNQLAVYEADARNVAQAERMRKQLLAEAEATFGYGVDTSLPSFKNSKGAQHYQNAYARLLAMQHSPFSVKKATFIIENAFYEETKEYMEFERAIKQTGDFLREKMKELKLDSNSNLAKNYLLFQFFADTLEIRSKGLKHLPFEYDFDDFWGKRDWSNMFVHKLLLTGKGQCSSLPKLYLILAEEIGAKAHLALSPNHSYIKFPDDAGHWHNIELTNNMLTTDAFILNSGFVKSAAIQNRIFMHPLDEREFRSHLSPLLL
ncbi:hypothetical protein L0P88_12995 [Muricauda sp. SCSIO 64092]|uniref:hypothetical protein n=1 Tax=Allomuricauda sp. SCSIO 64092 TaxID=2908842 RepID=UPI001FF5EC31|nr:hypothetical protein [Muricauda sp. SCSIO 64092]UOY04869.1 hypothetical protein L0P88_12995 [Muricauda sp. SCSIO 64092]